MSHALLDSVTEHFAELDDPRRDNANRRHEFLDILAIALCAVIGGANHWTDVVTFARAKEGWFRRVLRLSNGIPSHDTFSDVFAKIEPERFERCFLAWVEVLRSGLPGAAVADAPVIAVDGKTLRRSHDRANGTKAAHIVSAYAEATSMVLGQVRTSDKSNEITAIAILLDMIALDGALVTIDAMGCQRAIAEKVVERGADYLLTVKENQSELCIAIGNAFCDNDRERFARRFGEAAEQENAGHGRAREETLLGVHRPRGDRAAGEYVEGARKSGGHRLRAHRRGQGENERRSLVHQQPRRHGGTLSAGAAATLVGGKRAALSVGCGLSRGRVPGEERRGGRRTSRS